MKEQVKAKHEPGKVWMLRRVGEHPNGSVRTLPDGWLEIQYSPERNPFEDRCFKMSRATARLLAKRIMECLEGTKG